MKWSWVHSFGILLVVIFIVVLFQFPNFAQLHLNTAWFLNGFLLVVFLVIVGSGIVNRFAGVLIDERNRMSLSRLQLVVWTVMFLSAYLTAVVWNISVKSSSNPLTIKIPPELWWLIGISTTSLVGTPLILNAKKENTASPDQLSKTKALLKNQKSLADDASIAAQGQVIYFKTPTMAGFSDLFKGDGVANSGQVDLGKVQMFFFTIVIVLTYVGAISSYFMKFQGKQIDGFPPLDAGMVTLLGISHAGYLGTKSASS